MAEDLLLIAAGTAGGAERLSRPLRERGIRPVVAVGVDEALRRSLAEDPTVILIDADMPEADGFELCEKIRTAIGESLPILMVSGSYAAEARITKARVDAVLNEPFSFEVLGFALRRLGIRIRGITTSDEVRALAEAFAELGDDRAMEIVVSAHEPPAALSPTDGDEPEWEELADVPGLEELTPRSAAMPATRPAAAQRRAVVPRSARVPSPPPTMSLSLDDLQSVDGPSELPGVGIAVDSVAPEDHQPTAPPEKGSGDTMDVPYPRERIREALESLPLDSAAIRRFHDAFECRRSIRTTKESEEKDDVRALAHALSRAFTRELSRHASDMRTESVAPTFRDALVRALDYVADSPIQFFNLTVIGRGTDEGGSASVVDALIAYAEHAHNGLMAEPW